MNRFITAVLFLSLISFVFPQQGHAQMRNFEQNMAKMKVKLPPSIFDGKTLKITKYEELQQVKQFGLNYRGFLQNALGAWEKLGRGQNEERRNQLIANKEYFNAFQKAYTVKAKEIKAPVKKKPVQVKEITLSDVFIGPDVNKDGPIILDTIGGFGTEFKAYGRPGTKAKPTRWLAQLQFFIKYKDIEKDDAVMIEVFKDGKSLGKPTSCQFKYHHQDFHLAYYQCDAPKMRSDYEDLYQTGGPHTIKLTYKNLVAGKEFKDFAVFKVNVKKAMHGSANNPSLKWQTDHDMKLAVSTIQEGASKRGIIKFAKEAAFRSGTQTRSMVINTWFKTGKATRVKTQMTCLYHDRRIAQADSFKIGGFSYWSFLKKGSMEKEEANWVHHAYYLKSMFPRRHAKATHGRRKGHFLNDNPGEYRCIVTGDGEVLKELFFRVGLDGNIVKPACQLESMNTPSTVTLLAAEDKILSTVDYDKKIGQQYGFEGRVKWSKSCPPDRK